MDVESFEDGYVSKLLVPEGGSVKVRVLLLNVII